MDEELVGGPTQLEIDEDSEHQGKEDRYALNTKIFKSQEIPRAVKGEHDELRQGKNVSEEGSKHPRESLFRDVEELTVKSYNGSTLDIGTSSNRQQIYNNRQNRWLNLSQIGSHSGQGNTVQEDADAGSTSFAQLLARKSLSDGHTNVIERLEDAENKESAPEVRGQIRTKIISNSGFAEYFIKNTLKGKGIICRGPSSDVLAIHSRDKNQMKAGTDTDQNPVKTAVDIDQNKMKTGIRTDQHQKTGSDTQWKSNISASYDSITAKCPSYGSSAPRSAGFGYGGVTLREWLKSEQHKASKVECLHLFRKIVYLVDDSHSQGTALNNLYPSYIRLLPSNQVMHVGLPIQKQMSDSVLISEVLPLNDSLSSKRLSEQVTFASRDMGSKKQKFNEGVRISGSDSCLENASDRIVHSAGSQDYCNEYEEDIRNSKYNIGRMSSVPRVSSAGQSPLISFSERMEAKWYASPEGGCTISSNIYCLGVLLFELLGHFDSERARIAAMSDLQHRILPPVFLSENPKEAGFCLWLLHPEPSSRPTTREILQSEVINGLNELYSEELSSNIEQDDAESELLLHFLVSLKEKRQKDASKLVEEIRCLESDIEEVERRHDSLDLSDSYQREIGKEAFSLEMLNSISPMSDANDLRLLRNMCHLESAYFSLRSKVRPYETDAATHPDKSLLRCRENWHMAQKGEEHPERNDSLGTFFDGLCKYARYSKFEVRGVLRNADFNNPANVICSLSFDRDGDYFASAGISKKIKVFDFNALCDDSVDIHYPVFEMSNESKLSCVCWNNYIKNYLASTDYDGVVKLWDASTGQEFSQLTEHEKRAWSVDFSPVCPTKLASGSDDCSVKLWNISERNSLGTITNVANVCCVQFSAHSSHLLAFGSADYSTYCYDTRNLRSPWCVLAGHRKAVSYVKFLDSGTLVSASTDNTLKIWDLSKTSPVAPSASACTLTLSGHTNEKNFVGLSVSDGYIACGSETNEVYSYYKSLPMPITSHKFGSIDPISGKDTDDDNGHLIGSFVPAAQADAISDLKNVSKVLLRSLAPIHNSMLKGLIFPITG
ncbi:hypothetical protein PIB30_038762 [Stylosanthes scabra]|uniref:Uncharacterized protein n=1 Tax=Stylosanthes scabra TaxID=79078 RepID=A0ABU6WFC9_9FABA|nr:hypothetical protein [Stylosanthes scabra]